MMAGNPGGSPAGYFTRGAPDCRCGLPAPTLAGKSGDHRRGCHRIGAFQALTRKANTSNCGGVSTVSWGMPGSGLA
jgi:hypothetical protein